jgi:hypothetical protein
MDAKLLQKIEELTLYVIQQTSELMSCRKDWMRRKQKSEYMRNLGILLISMIITASACHKNKYPHYLLSAPLKDSFGYNSGSYWIYKDSVSGAFYSFYVQSSFGTVFETDAYIDQMAVGFQCNNNIPVNNFGLTLIDSACSISIIGKTLFLFSYPFMNRGAGGDYDSGYVQEIPFFSINNNNYANIILSYHTNSKIFSTSIYEHKFYVSSTAGIIKIRISQSPYLAYKQDSIFQVLELQSYYIAK